MRELNLNLERPPAPLRTIRPSSYHRSEMLPGHEGLQNLLQRQEYEMIEKYPWLEVKTGLLPSWLFKSTL